MENGTAVAASAPGKVLLAGGYLVVDRQHSGLVFGLSARIHVHVEPLRTTDGVKLSEIIVRSPQFRDAEWRYGYRQTEQEGGIEVIQLKGHSTAGQSRNKFVETALAYALTYVSSHSTARIAPASVTILADSDYYSQTETQRNESGKPKGRFVDFNVPLQEAHKTGLGSSAALVTAFTAAILAFYLHADKSLMDTEAGKRRIHNLAQASHCTAQGKIGSGFDVAAAVYGSCVYKRFSPAVLEKPGELGSKEFSKRLRETVDDEAHLKVWDTEINKSVVQIPESLRLVMCDVDCGSETPSMVRKVFAWRKNNAEEAALLWATLQKGNEDLAAELQRLATTQDSGKPDWENLCTIILTIRSLIREMSDKAGVPIEPKVQTDLIDGCTKIPGVIGGVVPGAGGFDAIVLLVEDQPKTINELGRFVEGYKVSTGEGEDARIGQVRLLGVKQEMEGIKVEDTNIYAEWFR